MRPYKNPITIAVAGIPPEKVFVTTSAGTLTGEKGKYVLSLPDPKTQLIKEVKLTIYEIIKPGSQKEIGIRIFRVKNVPKPLAYISSDNSCNTKNFSEGEIYIKDVKKLDQVIISMQDFYFKSLDYTLVKYKLLIAPKDTLQGASAFEGVGSNLTLEMKTALNNAKDHDIIMIYDIYCTFPGSSVLRLPTSISLTVKK